MMASAVAVAPKPFDRLPKGLEDGATHRATTCPPPFGVPLQPQHKTVAILVTDRLNHPVGGNRLNHQAVGQRVDTLGMLRFTIMSVVCNSWLSMPSGVRVTL
jgi:hypothetical protein